jgi:AraC-like DNA-binding protein
MSGELRVTPPRVAGVATYPAGATFGPRRLREYEFVWIIEGEVEYRWGRATVAAPPGAIVLCRAGETDFFRFDPRGRTRHGYFHFSILALPAGWPDPAGWPLVRRASDDDLLRPLFRHLLTWAGKGSALQCELTIAHLLTAFISGETAIGDVPREPLPAAVERALGHIHERLEREPDAGLCLADLARAAGVNREHLCRLFTAATGRSPMETVRLARLDRAAMLLARSNYSIGEIAALHGFASPFHFSRRFKEAYGCAPRELRRRLAAGETPPTPRLLRTTPRT